MINTIFNYNDALNICNQYYSKLSETSVKKPPIYDEYNSVPIQIKFLNDSLWKISEQSIKNTLNYIYHIICHQCYLFTIIQGKKTFYKLLPDKLSPTYLNAIKEAKLKVNENEWLNDHQKSFIQKLNPNRIMQCIVKKVDFNEKHESNEYLDLFKRFNIPDGIFILNLTDAVIMRDDNNHPFKEIMNFSNNKKFNRETEYLPILSISSKYSFMDIPIPNYDDIDYVYNDKDDFNKKKYDGFITKWEHKKINKAVFRGSPTGCGYTSNTNMRLKLYELSLLDEYKDRLDIGITSKGNTINSQSVRFDPKYGLGMLNTDIKPSSRLTIPEQSHYKYIIHVDGNVNAYRLLYTMATGSLILRVKSEYQSWAEPYLLRDIHFKQINSNLSDLKLVLDWCEENQAQCKRIASNGMELARTLLTETFMNHYFNKLFWHFDLKPKSMTKFDNYWDYKKHRITIQPMLLDPNTAVEPETCKVAIIIPHRERIHHLKEFIQHFNQFELKHKLDIYVINQHNHIKFNRGLLLNIGYYISSHFKYDRYIFHDVDSYPDQTLFDLYFKELDKIIHFQRPDNSKYDFPEFFGGIEGFTSTVFEQVNGFPNNFFGWGGEDDALYNRLVMNQIMFYRPKTGKYNVPYHPNATDINPIKGNLILEDLNDWKKNGIKQIQKLDISVTDLSLQDFIDTYNDKKLIELYKLNQVVKKFKLQKKQMNYYCFHVDFNVDDDNHILEIESEECNMAEVKLNPIYKQYPDKKNLICNYQRILRNFKEYIMTEPMIDYTYILDFILDIFNTNFYNINDKTSKLNLIIFDMTMNSNYVDLICRPSAYTDEDTDYMILLKRGNVYSPIISLNKTVKKEDIYSIFKKNDNTINYNLYQFLNLVPSIFNKCNTEYKHPMFTNPIHITDIINMIFSMPQYKFNGMFMNHMMDIVGVVVEYEKEKVILYGIPIHYYKLIKTMKDIPYYVYLHYEPLTYTATKHLLEKIYEDSKQEIPCNPMKKVLDENNEIIGILTISNSFVEVVPDIIIDDDLPIHRDMNYSLIDQELLNHITIDDDHEKYTKSIDTETKLYNLFRLFIKNHLSYSIHERQELLKIYHSEDKDKLNQMYDFLTKTYKDKIIFKEINNLHDIQILNKCIYDCMTTKCKKRLCDLIIPLYNLVTGTKNEIIYFSRLSDEILRYKLIHQFMLKNDTYLPFYDTKYKINQNEILITKNLLDQYFENLEPLQKFENITYHHVNSNLQKIHKNINFNEYITNQDCSYVKKIIDTRKLLFEYPLLKEKIYINSPICTIQVIIDIIYDYTTQKLDYQTIRQLLLKLYKNYPSENILSILYKEGKPITSLNYILENKYYFTPFDFKVLSNHFHLPIINMTSKEQYIKDIKDKVYCISNTPIHNNIIPSYSIIMNNETIQLNLSNVKVMSKYTDLQETIMKTKIYQQIK
jgi:N-terminal region of glycosyl transferase group 7/N-terminal domain of galactosyltransferase/Glycosyl transferase family 90